MAESEKTMGEYLEEARKKVEERVKSGMMPDELGFVGARVIAGLNTLDDELYIFVPEAVFDAIPEGRKPPITKLVCACGCQKIKNYTKLKSNSGLQVLSTILSIAQCNYAVEQVADEVFGDAMKFDDVTKADSVTRIASALDQSLANKPKAGDESLN